MYQKEAVGEKLMSTLLVLLGWYPAPSPINPYNAKATFVQITIMQIFMIII